MFRFKTVEFAVLISIFVVLAVSSVDAKIYIWTDENNRTHYCNDPDDVPQEYREKLRTIETQASSSSAQKTTPVPVDTPDVPPDGKAPTLPPRELERGQAPPVLDAERVELAEIMNAYQMKRQELKQFRKSGKDLHSTEYEDLRQQLTDIKNRLRDARKDSRKTKR